MKTKAEKREKIKRNRGKMIVQNRSIFILRKIKVDKARKHDKEKE